MANYRHYFNYAFLSILRRKNAMWFHISFNRIIFVWDQEMISRISRLFMNIQTTSETLAPVQKGNYLSRRPLPTELNDVHHYYR